MTKKLKEHNWGFFMRKTAIALLVEMYILGLREGWDGND